MGFIMDRGLFSESIIKDLRRMKMHYMYVDATYFSVRGLSACRSKALYIVIGITADG